jgi:hypothetical protein
VSVAKDVGTTAPLLQTAMDDGRVPEAARPLAEHECEGLVGWMLHRN